MLGTGTFLRRLTQFGFEFQTTRHSRTTKKQKKTQRRREKKETETNTSYQVWFEEYCAVVGFIRADVRLTPIDLRLNHHHHGRLRQRIRKGKQ